MTKRYEKTVGRESVPTDEYRDILSPANGEVVGRAHVATQEHLDQAVAAAAQAFSARRHSSEEDRRDACRKIAKVCEDNAPELSVLLTRKQGKSLGVWVRGSSLAAYTNIKIINAAA